MIKKLLAFAVGFFILLAIFGAIYAGVQQNYRQSANDPQIQMSQDAVAALNAGQKAEAIAGANKITLPASLAPFLIIFDSAGKPLASSVQINGQTPVPPSGVFASVKAGGEDRVTWQTKDGIRIAAVINQSHDGFVLAGRSLREVEKREAQLAWQTELAWLFSVVVFGLFICLKKSKK